MKNLQYKIGLILNDDTPETPLKKRVGLLILFLILISSIEVILESIVSLDLKYHELFIVTDVVLSILFSIEYVLRIWTYRVDGAIPTLKHRVSHLFSFYMLIDFVSILPFFLSIFISSGFGFLRIIRILRLFRLMKFVRYMKSQNLVVNAIKNKGKELILSMQVVLFLTVILSAILYHIENTVQPENFGDIVDAFVWSLSKFIGGVGGYGDFEPITFWGQVMATIVGLLGIALFAVPAGIIGAGFVEEIESIKADEDLIEKNNRLLDTFNFEHISSYVRNKKQLGIEHARRKFLSIQNAELRLQLTKTDLLEIADKGHGVKLRIKDLKEHIEVFNENTSYGTLNNRGANITIVSTHSETEPFMGHFTYIISEYLKANYLSSEIIHPMSFKVENRYNLLNNDDYFKDDIQDNPFQEFKNDLLNTVNEKSTVIYFLCSATANGSFHILNGDEKGVDAFKASGGTYDNVDKLESFYDSLCKDLEGFDQTDERYYSKVGKHLRYGNHQSNGFHWMLRENMKANVVLIYVSTEILKSKANFYYPVIKILGDNIKEHLS
tara:strand:+ start:145 stop:1803 length:1659 start_codon:yes stop_codon:yes gene_type:complete